VSHAFLDRLAPSLALIAALLHRLARGEQAPGRGSGLVANLPRGRETVTPPVGEQALGRPRAAQPQPQPAAQARAQRARPRSEEREHGCFSW
jgi:hypothetical protein